jgi:hypothetical protein
MWSVATVWTSRVAVARPTMAAAPRQGGCASMGGPALVVRVAHGDA